MLSPIRPLQSTEVRRVDEVTPRKHVAARVPSPFAETTDGVRLTIGDDARRLAYRRGSSFEQSTAEDRPANPALVPSRGTSPDGEAEGGLLQGAALPLAFQSEVSAEQPATGSPGDANALANRALRAFTSGGSTQARSSEVRESSFPEDEGGRPWGPEDSSKVPFEVFQRAVTDATAGVAASKPDRAANYSPLQPIFYAPENGGEPFGRAVPFEEEDVSASTSDPSGRDSAAGSKLSKEDVDQLLADLNWSLPEQSVPSSRTAAA